MVNHLLIKKKYMARAERPSEVASELEDFDSLIAKNDKKALKKLIKKHGIDAYDGDKRTILINSVAKGNIEIARFAIENGADVNFQDQSGYTSLHFCALYKYADLTDVLIGKGANVNIRDEHGNPAIWTAIFNAKGDFSIVRKLYKAGADIETKNKHGKSPRDFGETVYQEKFGEVLKG
jgi:ankyrin repeat protein